MFYCPVAVNHQLFEWFPSLIRPFITTFENCANRFIPLDIWHTDLSRKKKGLSKVLRVSPSLSFLYALQLGTGGNRPWTTEKDMTLAQNTIRKV